jgi:hypothetical protein
MKRKPPKAIGNTPVLKFYRRNLDTERILCGDDIIDGIINFNIGTSVLFKGEMYSGLSALCFEYVEHNTKNGRIVLYVDCLDSIKINRFEDTNFDNFVYITPNSANQLLDILSDLKKELDDVLIILDNIYLLEGISVSNVVSDIKAILPKSSIMCIDKRNTVTMDIWYRKYNLEIVKKYYIDRIPIGHLLSIKEEASINPSEDNHFVVYKNGRLSKVYEHMTKELKMGKTKKDIFEFDNKRVQGFWKMLEEIEK